MKKPRMVILGGGFGGVYTAQGLQSCWPLGERFDVTLIKPQRTFRVQAPFPGSVRRAAFTRMRPADYHGIVQESSPR